MLAISMNPLDWVTDAASSVVDGAVDTAFNFLATWISDALSWLAAEIMDRIISAGGADVADGLFAPGGPANVIYWLGLVSVVAGVSLQVTSTMWRRDAGMTQMTETLLDLPVTVVMMFALPTVGVTILRVCDLAAEAIGTQAFAAGFGESLDLDVGMPGFMRAIVGTFMILVLVVLYVVQLVRSHLATVLIVLGPFTIAMRSWAPVRTVLEATVKLFAALAITPLVMMTMVAVALYRYENVGALDLSRALAVLAGLLLAVLSPFVANKLFPIGDGLAAGIAGGAVVGGAMLAMKAAGGVAGAAGGAAVAGASRMGQLVSPASGAAAVSVGQVASIATITGGGRGSSEGGGAVRAAGSGARGGGRPIPTPPTSASRSSGGGSSPGGSGSSSAGSVASFGAVRSSRAAGGSGRPAAPAKAEGSSLDRLLGDENGLI